jgi:hypothetical protein
MVVVSLLQLATTLANVVIPSSRPTAKPSSLSVHSCAVAGAVLRWLLGCRRASKASSLLRSRVKASNCLNCQACMQHNTYRHVTTQS